MRWLWALNLSSTWWLWNIAFKYGICCAGSYRDRKLVSRPDHMGLDQSTGVDYVEHEHKCKNTIERWIKEVVRFLLTMLADSWQTRCELLNEKDASEAKKYTWRLAYNLVFKLQPTSWYLPSASRHLLDRDETFFRTKSIRDVSVISDISFGVGPNQLLYILGGMTSVRCLAVSWRCGVLVL